MQNRISIEAEPPGSDAALACLRAYFAELATRFEAGFDPLNGGSIVDPALGPPGGVFLILRVDGAVRGCGGVRMLSADTAEIKRMWIAPEARGQGLAGRLLTALEDAAGALGARRIRLDTNRVLQEAQALYDRRGYRPIPPYNDNPYADFWFERLLDGHEPQEGNSSPISR